MFRDVTPFPIVLSRRSTTVHVRVWQLAFRDVHICDGASEGRVPRPMGGASGVLGEDTRYVRRADGKNVNGSVTEPKRKRKRKEQGAKREEKET